MIPFVSSETIKFDVYPLQVSDGSPVILIDTGKNDEEALVYIVKAIEKAGYVPGADVNLGIDVAASEFYEDGKYVLKGEGRILTTEELINFYVELVNDAIYLLKHKQIANCFSLTQLIDILKFVPNLEVTYDKESNCFTLYVPKKTKN